MRRFSAFLMIAALVAVLVPSAALAGKVSPGIDSFKVWSGGEVMGQCFVNFTIAWHGRPYDVYVAAYTSEDVYHSAMVTTLSSKTNPASYGYPVATAALGSNELHWQATLEDRKGLPLGSTVETGPDPWTDPTKCPPGGYVLGEWSIYG